MISKTVKFSVILLPLLLLCVTAFSQAPTEGPNPNFYNGLMANGMIALVLLVSLGGILALFHLMNVMIKMQQIKIYQENGLEEYLEAVKNPSENFWQKIYKRWTNVVPVEKEADIMMDHNYDGIRELDNSLPPWWVAMFYITIAIAVIYFGYYHVLGYGPSSAEKYEMEMAEAKEQINAFQAKQANLIDENNVALLTAEADIAAGKTIYDINCIACHGALGEGGIGPNLTDAYWIHGAGIKNVFSTIKYGVPEKGMIPWQTQLRPAEMNKVASYILSLQGTNPPGGKAPEGDLYKGDGTPTAADTTGSGAIGLLTH